MHTQITCHIEQCQLELSLEEYLKKVLLQIAHTSKYHVVLRASISSHIIFLLLDQITCQSQPELSQDALEHKQKMEAENKALKEKLDREAGELKKKMADADDEKAEEMKILQNRLDSERRLLNEKMEREKV